MWSGYLEGDFLFRAVGLLLADELRLASSGREKVVVGGKRVIPAPYDVEVTGIVAADDCVPKAVI